MEKNALNSLSNQFKNKVSKLPVKEADSPDDAIDKLYTSLFASLRSTA